MNKNLEKTADAKGSLMDKTLNYLRDTVAKTGENAVPLAIASAGGIGLGALISMLGDNKDSAAKKRRNIKLYQAIESPYASEEDVIDESLHKRSSLVSPLDAAVYAGSATIPTYLAYDAIRNRGEKARTARGRHAVGELRDIVNEAYRKDMMKAYGIADEGELKSLVKELNDRANELDKTSDELTLSIPAAVTGATALGLGSFLTMKNMADQSNPAIQQRKAYLDKLDKLYRERLVSPTINELPFSEDELMAMELKKQEGGKRAPKVKEPALLEADAPMNDSSSHKTVDMDDPGVQSIIDDL